MEVVWQDRWAKDVWERWGTVDEAADALGGRQHVEKYHICVKCKAELEKTTVAEARRAIRGPHCGSAVQHARQYAAARRKAQTAFQFTSLKMLTDGMADAPMRKRELRDLIHNRVVVEIKDLKEMLRPLAEVLLLKAKDEDLTWKAAANFVDWSESLVYEIPTDEIVGVSLREANDDDRVAADRAEIALEAAAGRRRGFAARGAAQEALWHAADFTDMWYTEGTGHEEKALYVYYVCMARSPPCGTCISSDEWIRLHEDRDATGQRYYCRRPECGARYRQKSGVIRQAYAPRRPLHERPERAGVVLPAAPRRAAGVRLRFEGHPGPDGHLQLRRCDL